MNTKVKTELINSNGYDAVTIKETHDTGYRQYNVYLQVSADIELETLEIKDFSYCKKRDETDTLANWTSWPEYYVTAGSLQAARDHIRHLVNEQRRRIAAFKKTPLFDAMYKRAGVVQYYRTDFEIRDCDRLQRWIEKGGSVNGWIWLVRNTGTWLLNMEKPNDNFTREIVRREIQAPQHNVYVIDTNSRPMLQAVDTNKLQEIAR